MSRLLKIVTLIGFIGVSYSEVYADLTFEQTGASIPGSSYIAPLSINGGFLPQTFDAALWRVTGDSFESAAFAPAGGASDPSFGWTQTSVSADLKEVFAEGPGTTLGLGNALNYELTFAGDLSGGLDPGITGVGQIALEVFLYHPGEVTPFQGAVLAWVDISSKFGQSPGTTYGFDFAAPSFDTPLRATAVVAAPVPGAFVLGAIGLGMLGFVRKWTS